ncbi:unnamed protein product, partial [Laminaria digitata]
YDFTKSAVYLRQLKKDQQTAGLVSAACLRSFSNLTKNVPIDAVVKVLYSFGDGIAGHLVAVGPGGFQLCTCLKLLRCGLPCCHVLAALFTELRRGGEFTGASVHPRWRSSSGGPWSVRSAGLGAFDGPERGAVRGGFTGDFEDMEIEIEDSEDEDSGDCCGGVVAGRASAAAAAAATDAAATTGATATATATASTDAAAATGTTAAPSAPAVATAATMVSAMKAEFEAKLWEMSEEATRKLVDGYHTERRPGALRRSA